MAGSARLIRRRIKSVSNTKKITKAMELVSAAKMRRAVAAATSARRYASLGRELLASLAAHGVTIDHTFFRQPSGKGKALCIVITSDRGLCGAYNVQLMRAVELGMARFTNVEYVTVGKYGDQTLRRTGKTVIASFPGLTNQPRAASVRPIVSLATNEFVSGTYERVFIASTEFRSALRQVPQVSELLPLAAPADATSSGLSEDALFEPNPVEVLTYALPRFIEAAAYQAVLEAAASEHSARMMSMRSATDAASDMLDDLTFTLNQARQSAITSEIAEISAGRAALEG
jgi:F-type H+-transporting ATPase subunit gamma